MMEMFYVYTGVSGAQVYVFVKTHQIAHLNYMYFTVYNFYFHKHNFKVNKMKVSSRRYLFSH